MESLRTSILPHTDVIPCFSPSYVSRLTSAPYLASSPGSSRSTISENAPETASSSISPTPPPLSMALPKHTTQSAKLALWAIDPPASTSRIDPTTLLSPSDLVRPSPSASVACAPGAGMKKKRACAGCTCGLAEREGEEMQREAALSVDLGEAEQPMDPEMMRLAAAIRAANKMTPGMKTSSCGSCYMGDAFRCSGCPYFGLPAFQPGDKVELPSR